jgi:cytoskeletal protein CcmA (bactofilin family)
MWKRDQSVPSTNAQRPQAEAPQVAEPPPIVRPAPTPKLVMNLGDSVVIKGELSGSEDLTLCGQMEGSVRLPDHTLTIGPSAEIKAEISAKAVVVMGAVVGNVKASDRVEIQAAGSVTGDVTAPRFAIADGGGFRGRVEMPLVERRGSSQPREHR